MRNATIVATLIVLATPCAMAQPSEDDPQKPALKIDINEFLPNQTFSGKLKLNLENGSTSSGPAREGENDNGIREGVAWLLYGDAGIVASRLDRACSTVMP